MSRNEYENKPADPSKQGVERGIEDIEREFEELEREGVEDSLIGEGGAERTEDSLITMPSRMGYRERLRKNNYCLINPIIENQTFNLIGGPSGMGKSTLLFQTLYDWDHEKPVFGKWPSTRCHYVYITMDRSTRQTDKTLMRLGYKNWDIPIYSIDELAGVDNDLNLIMDKFPKHKLFVIEGLQGLIPDGKGDQNRREMQWVISIRKRLAARDATIIATTHTPKTQTDKAHSRNNFLMSASMHACMDTMISIDLPRSARDAKVETYTDDREIVFHLRNHRDIRMSCTRDESGRLVEMGPDLTAEANFDSWLSGLAPGTDIPTSKLREKMEKSTMSKSVFYRMLEQHKEAGALVWVRKGLYQKGPDRDKK